MKSYTTQIAIQSEAKTISGNGRIDATAVESSKK